MYIQLTEKCNMTCAHCCFAATTKGETMSRDVFIRALDLARQLGEFVTLGGGEPTVHPAFIAFAEKAMEYAQKGWIEDVPFVVTNGKLVTKARKLLEWVAEGRPIAVALSQDEWHDPIRPEIVVGFARLKRLNRYMGSSTHADIRTVRHIIPVGRAAQNRDKFAELSEDSCCCESLFVDPLGNIFSCGCRNHLLGNVFEHDIAEVLCDLEHNELHTGGGVPAREHARLYPQQAQAA